MEEDGVALKIWEAERLVVGVVWDIGINPRRNNNTATQSREMAVWRRRLETPSFLG